VTHILNWLTGLLVALFDLILAGIAILEGVARRVLASFGIGGQTQTALLALFGVLLIVASFRLFGRVFAVLIGLILLLLLLHALVAGAPHVPA